MPEWRAEILRRLASARLRPEREAEIADEVAQHLDDRYRTLMGAGVSPEDAERAAWRELDDADILGRRLAGIDAPAPPPLTHVEAPAHRQLLAGLSQDLRYAVRGLAKRPLFSTAVVVTLALSLGPTTAALGVANTLLFKPLDAIARQDRLINISFGTPRGDGYSPWFISYANAADISRDASTIATMTGQQFFYAGLASGGSTPERLYGAAVSVNYFATLGLRPTAGRDFQREDDLAPGGEPVVIIGEPLARTLFGDAATAIGKPLTINGVPYSVIGVMPAAFAGTTRSDRVAFWITGLAYVRATNAPAPRWRYDVNRGPFYMYIARMADGASVSRTMAELQARTRAIAERDPERGKLFETVGPILQPGFAAPASLRPQATLIVTLVGIVAGLLALLGMANVTNLLIFRGIAARRDVVIRKALGASARRLLQLRLIESLVLALTGAAAGVLVAAGLNRVLSNVTLPALGALDVALDWRTLFATAAVAVVVGVGFGLAPAMLAVRESVTGATGRGARTAASPTLRLRHALAAVQIALSLTLLVGALLFLATLRNLRAIDLGFDPSGVVTVNVALRAYGYNDARALDFERRLAEAVNARPGVRAAIAYSPPLIGASFFDRAYLPSEDPNQAREVAVNGVSAEYFSTIGLPMLRGRAFTSDEVFRGADGPMPVILSATLARTLFGTEEDALDRELRLPQFQSGPIAARVVGVTRESHFGGIDTPADAVLYEPLGRFVVKFSAFVIARSALPAHEAAAFIADTAKAIDPAVALAPERTMDAIVDAGLAQQRLFASLLGALGAIGFVLAAVGLHGLVAQTVAERRREFGIRLAIGADRSRIARLVLRQTAVVLLAGLTAGVTMALLAGRFVESRLYGITSRDPWAYASAGLLITAVVIFASASPARTATRVNPVEILRVE
jgi:predicted permease